MADENRQCATNTDDLTYEPLCGLVPSDAIDVESELADMTLWEFRQLLASRGVSPHYDEAELEEDVATLRELGRL